MSEQSIQMTVKQPQAIEITPEKLGALQPFELTSTRAVGLASIVGSITNSPAGRLTVETFRICASSAYSPNAR